MVVIFSRGQKGDWDHHRATESNLIGARSFLDRGKRAGRRWPRTCLSISPDIDTNFEEKNDARKRARRTRIGLIVP